MTISAITKKKIYISLILALAIALCFAFSGDVLADEPVDPVVTDGPSQIILSWTGDPTTTQSVIWCDNSGAAGYVQYVEEDSYTDENSFDGANEVSATSKAVGYGAAAKTYYEATMTGLTADTIYYYRVGSSENWSEAATFSTAPSSTASAGQDFSFLFMGDVQYNTDPAAEYAAWGTLLNLAYAANPNLAFGLLGGDMVQSGSNMNDWTYFLSNASEVFSKIPMMTTNGNHESNFISGKPQFYKDIFALPENGPAGFEEEFYSFDYGSVHVTILNSWALPSEQNPIAAQRTAISDWLTADLAVAADAKFRIVMLHHPAYALANDTVAANVLANWTPLLEGGNVDLVLCGHQHVYARSYPMLAGEINYESGITYVMGNSGQKFYGTADPTYQEKLIFNQSTCQILNVDCDTLSLATFDSEGNLLDFWSTTAKTTPVLSPPLLSADSTDNIVGQDVTLCFPDNEAWRMAISAVSVDEIALESGKYSVSAGTVVIDRSVFSTAKDYVIIISAAGYSDAAVNQVIHASGSSNPVYTVTPLEDAVYTIGATPAGIKTMTVKGGEIGFKFFTVNISPVTAHSGNETAVFVHERDGFQRQINATWADFDLVEEAKGGFNVLAGDVIKVYLVDELSNALDFNPTILQ